MIAAILWKEGREQRTIIAAVLAFGFLVLFATAEFADPSTGSGSGPREIMPLALAYLAGSVCGAMLLADEKENGTLEFLDTMPCRRSGLWLGKAGFGIVASGGQGLALGSMAIALGCYEQRIPPASYVAGVIIAGLLAFSWGMFGAAIARTSLGAVFQGSVGMSVTAIALSVPLVLAFSPREFRGPTALAPIVYVLLLGFFGLLGSLLLFARTDRYRQTAAPAARRKARATKREWRRLPGVGALIWLSARQSVWITAGCFGAAAVVGAAMLLPEMMPLFMWPGLTLTFGVVAGVTTFTEEQGGGVAKFWAERRLPLGRLWLSKVLFHFAIAAGAGLILFLPQLALADSQLFQSGLFRILRAERGRFLWLGLVYGFAFGHLMGFAFKKTVVSGLVATLAAVTTVGLILPSLLGGGLHGWQVWTPAILLMITARMLLYPWATGRVLDRGPLIRVVGGTVAAAAALGASIGYRVYEIPDMPDRYAESGFEKALIPYDENKAGLDIRAAVSQFRQAEIAARPLVPRRVEPIAQDREGFVGDPSRSGESLLDRIQNEGWSDEFAPLVPWLNRVFNDTWEKNLDAAANRPIGVYDDPRDLDYFTKLDAMTDLRDMIAAMRMRSLQRQAEGDAATFVRFFRGGLTAARAVRHQSGLTSVRFSFIIESILFDTFDNWLAGPGVQPDQLRAVLAILVEHERLMPLGVTDLFWAEQMIVRNTMDRSNRWLPDVLNVEAKAKLSMGSEVQKRIEAEVNLIGIAWTFPWEKARRERILRVMSHGAPANVTRAASETTIDGKWLSPLHVFSLWLAGFEGTIPRVDKYALTRRRLAAVSAALRVYEIDRGSLPDRVEHLVPKYLSSVPLDPYGSEALKYRRSTGEQINSELNISILSWKILSWSEYWSCEVVLGLCPLIAGLDPRELNELKYISTSNEQLGAVLGGGAILGGTMMNDLLNAKVLVPEQNRPVGVGSGDGVLWSVGLDGRDDEGRLSLRDHPWLTQGGDWVVIIPSAKSRARAGSK